MRDLLPCRRPAASVKAGTRRSQDRSPPQQKAFGVCPDATLSRLCTAALRSASSSVCPTERSGHKMSDESLVPLCRDHHREFHRSASSSSWGAIGSSSPLRSPPSCGDAAPGACIMLSSQAGASEISTLGFLQVSLCATEPSLEEEVATERYGRLSPASTRGTEPSLWRPNSTCPTAHFTARDD